MQHLPALHAHHKDSAQHTPDDSTNALLTLTISTHSCRRSCPIYAPPAPRSWTTTATHGACSWQQKCVYLTKHLERDLRRRSPNGWWKSTSSDIWCDWWVWRELCRAIELWESCVVTRWATPSSRLITLDRFSAPCYVTPSFWALHWLFPVWSTFNKLECIIFSRACVCECGGGGHRWASLIQK